MMREHFGQFGEGVDECVLKQKQVPLRSTHVQQSMHVQQSVLQTWQRRQL